MFCTFKCLVFAFFCFNYFLDPIKLFRPTAELCSRYAGRSVGGNITGAKRQHFYLDGFFLTFEGGRNNTCPSSFRSMMSTACRICEKVSRVTVQ